MKLAIFVCSGNTCRSPMAEALLKAHGELPDDWEVASAGVMAFAGMPASENAQRAVEERGLSLANHRSRKLSRYLIDEAALIVAMTPEHAEFIATIAPAAEKKLIALSVHDPIGGTLEDYRKCCAGINECLPEIIARMKA